MKSLLCHRGKTSLRTVFEEFGRLADAPEEVGGLGDSPDEVGGLGDAPDELRLHVETNVLI